MTRTRILRVDTRDLPEAEILYLLPSDDSEIFGKLLESFQRLKQNENKDEVEVVSRLEIESLVNSAQCPTRVEASVATKDQVEIMTILMILTMTSMKGLREGYKWLVKSVITNYLELGTRVSEDMAREAAEEEERRKEVRN